MSDVMEIVQNEDGTFSAYDDTYDIVIHCETEAEQKKAIDLMNSNRWIPVDERLPEPDKYIAISLDNCDIPAIGHAEIVIAFSGDFHFVSGFVASHRNRREKPLPPINYSMTS